MQTHPHVFLINILQFDPFKLILNEDFFSFYLFLFFFVFSYSWIKKYIFTLNKKQGWDQLPYIIK